MVKVRCARSAEKAAAAVVVGGTEGKIESQRLPRGLAFSVRLLVQCTHDLRLAAVGGM